MDGALCVAELVRVLAVNHGDDQTSHEVCYRPANNPGRAALGPLSFLYRCFELQVIGSDALIELAQDCGGLFGKLVPILVLNTGWMRQNT
jgi:hypothetical protein